MQSENSKKFSDVNMTSDSDSDPVETDWNKELINAIWQKTGESEADPEKYKLYRIKICLDEGADVNAIHGKSRETILHVAIKKNYQIIAKYLVAREARTDITNKKGYTALTLAETLGNQELANILKRLDNQQPERPIHRSSLAHQSPAVDNQQPSTSRETVIPSMDISPTEDIDNRSLSAHRATPKSKRKSTTRFEDDENVKRQRLELRTALPSELKSGTAGEAEIGNTTSCGRSSPDGDVEEMIQDLTSRFERELTYAAGGLKSSFHGVVYQLKHLGFTLLRAMRPKHGISFLLSTERVDVGKFDDVVLEFPEKALFLQLKHSRNESKRVNAHDLLEKKDGDFFVPKYFDSWREIKKSPLFGDKASKHVVLGTNIGINLAGLEIAEISCEQVARPVECLEMIGTNKKTTCFRFTADVKYNRKLYEKLKETSDVYVLARELVEHVLQRKKMTLVGIFKQYHTALGKQIIDTENKKFFSNFVKNKSLTPKSRIFRKIFFLEYSKQKSKSSKREVSENVIWKEIEESSLQLSKNFGAKCETLGGPQLTNIPLFSQEFIKLLKNGIADKSVQISRNIYCKNARKGSVERVVADNIDKLAGHVLVTKCGKIQFSSQFFDDSIQSTDSIKEFKDSLKSLLGSRFDELHQFEFHIDNFETMEKDQLYTKIELPDGKMAETDITEFLNSFILAMNLPDEVELGEMISYEIGEESKFNLLDPDLIGRTFLTKIVDWFKEKGEKVGEGKYLSYKGGEVFFQEMENRINTLKSMGVTSVYWEELKEYGIRFQCENRKLQAFLSESEPDLVSHRIMILTTPKEPLLTSLRVYQTLVQIEKYTRNDSFIFIRLRTLSLQGIKDQVVSAFQSQRCHHLLVIECDSASMKQNPQKLWFSLCKAMGSVQNKTKTIIVITREDDGLAVSLAGKLRKLHTTCIQQDDDIRFENLTKASRRKLLEKPIFNLQEHGGRVSFAKLLGQDDIDNIAADNLRNIAELIDSSTLVELIRESNEISIGGKLEGLGEIADYYINRRILRHVVITADIFKNHEIPDLFAISCDDGELQMETGQKRETSLMVRNLKNITILDRGKDVEQFERLCEKNVHRNIHWLKEQSGKLIWKQTVRSITHLLRYKDASPNDCSDGKTDAPYLTEKQFAAHDRPVIVSDTAGMGKSTIATYLSGIIKRTNPSMLVLKIDLNRHTTALANVRKNSSYNLGVIDGAVEFLVNELLNLQTDLEKNVFKAIIKNQRNAALIFDGFDEISPTHEKTVIELLDTLAKHEIKKLFVTTRPHTRELLENKLNTFSYEIQPFSVANQEDFLVKFWNNGLNFDDSDQKTQNRIRKYAQALITKLSDSINDRMNKFTGIPLQTKLVAEIFQNLSKGSLRDFDSCEKFKDSSDDQPSFPDKIDLIHLYELFVDMKFDNFFEKRGGNLADPGVIEGKKLSYDAFINAHEKLALNLLFTEEKVKQLLPFQADKTQEPNIVQERTGIITQFIDGKPQFGHRTYAEYFAAKFLFNKLRAGVQNPAVRKVFVADIFLGQSHETLRAFINCLLSDELPSFTGESWIPYFIEHRGSESRTIFHVTAIEANYQTMKLFLSSFTAHPQDLAALIDLRDEDGRTALYWTAVHGHLQGLKLLVELGGAKVDTNTGRDLTTALHIAASHGRLEMVKYLLSKNATVDSRAYANRTPLHLAAGNGKLDVVTHLLNNGAGVNLRTEDGETPLYEAVSSGRLNVVKYLMAKGADVNSTDKHGTAPLHIAADNNRIDLMECLITNDAMVNLPNHDGEIPLYTVAFLGHLEAVQYLIDKGADVNFQAKFGAKPLHVAAMKGNFDIVNCLFDNGAVIDTVADELTMLLADPSTHIESDIMEYWIDRDAFALPLNLAACASNSEVLRNWIDSVDEGVNCETMDDGITPLHVAACLGRLEIVEYLFKNGANVDPRTYDGSTPLYAAACTGKLEVVKYLLRNGAAVNSKNKYGDTPLHVASANNKLDVVEYLLGMGANVDCQNDVGKPDD